MSKTMCGKKLDILTLREWVENGIFISKMNNGVVSVNSRQTAKCFLSTSDKNEIEKLTLHPKPEMSPIYQKLYQENFDWIQEQHQKWIKDVVTVRCNNCWFHGIEDDLTMITEPEHHKVCPNCKTDDYLMDLK